VISSHIKRAGIVNQLVFVSPTEKLIRWLSKTNPIVLLLKIKAKLKNQTSLESVSKV